MSLTVSCPDCDKKLKVKDEAAGKKIRCPGCSKVFAVPTKSIDDDDFMNGLNDAVKSKKKRSSADEDTEEDDDVKPAPRARKSVKGNSKKSGRKSSSGSSGLLVRGLVGGLVGLAVLLFLGMLFAAVNQARKAAANRATANWIAFKHPTGSAQVDMPGTPSFNAAQSTNGAQTYSLMQTYYQMSLTAIPLPDAAQMAIATNPATVDLMFAEMESKTPQQMPGSRLIASRRIQSASVPALELKIDLKGNINLMRFYVFPQFLVGAEFITRNETAYTQDRERFFSSFRGPDGQSVDNATASTGPPANVAAPAAGSSQSATSSRTLSDARRALKTTLTRQERSGEPIPDPPASLAKKVQYNAPSGKLSAYLTTIPNAGQKSPAIIWISGGDFNSIDDGFFKSSPPENDQTASAFWKSGIVTMYPSLRGGNDNPGFKESFLGEVDDVLAAADFLASQPGIDPNRSYLGGHSTGGTLALLTAESTNKFRAIFSLGPVDDIRGYGTEFIFFDHRNSAELEPRSPAKWLHSIQNRTFVIEGAQSPGNLVSLLAMKNASRNPNAIFLAPSRANHFNILAPLTQLLAKKILADNGPATNIQLTESELELNYVN